MADAGSKAKHDANEIRSVSGCRAIEDLAE
jgi:hypothetical protein